MARVLVAALAAVRGFDDSDDEGGGNRAPGKEHMRYLRKCAFADFIFGCSSHTNMALASIVDQTG